MSSNRWASTLFWWVQTYNLNQKSERDVPIFDSLHCFNAYAARFLFFISVPGTLVLRASCFTIRLCLRAPLDSRLGLVLTGIVSNCIAPCIVIHYFCDRLCTLSRACQFHPWLSDWYIHIWLEAWWRIYRTSPLLCPLFSSRTQPSGPIWRGSGRGSDPIFLRISFYPQCCYPYVS